MFRVKLSYYVCLFPRFRSPTISQAAIVAFFSNLADVGLHASMMVLLLFYELEKEKEKEFFL